MKKTFTTNDSILFCNECGAEIFRCDECKKKFGKSEEILCDEGFIVVKHYCYKCKEKTWQ